MHELSLAESMLRIVEERARCEGFDRVRAIRLEIGKLSCVMPEALRFCFDAVTRGTIAAGARLDILEVGGAGRCPACRQTVALEEPYGICPDCSVPLAIVAGTEMQVKELEVACDATPGGTPLTGLDPDQDGCARSPYSCHGGQRTAGLKCA